uniref:Putative secreted protein n=1 Tax=Anopheles darlingi TaxID=43151 RepID=A0A2M4D2S1_ANODA
MLFLLQFSCHLLLLLSRSCSTSIGRTFRLLRLSSWMVRLRTSHQPLDQTHTLFLVQSSRNSCILFLYC